MANLRWLGLMLATLVSVLLVRMSRAYEVHTDSPVLFLTVKSNNFPNMHLEQIQGGYLIVTDILISPDGVPLPFFKENCILKQKQFGVKVIVSFGGTAVPCDLLAFLASDDTRRATFVNNLVEFTTTNGFHGIDLSWMYPAPHERDCYVRLLRELRIACDRSGLLLTVTVPSRPSVIEVNYPVRKLEKYADFVILSTTEFRKLRKTSFIAPLYSCRQGSTNSIDYHVNSWKLAGLSSSKLVIVIQTMSLTYKLYIQNEYRVGTPALQLKMRPYCNICRKLYSGSLEIWDGNAKCPYAFRDLYWYSYENEKSIREKVSYTVKESLAGIAVFHYDEDDPFNICGDGAYPLTAIVKSAMQSGGKDVAPVSYHKQNAPSYAYESPSLEDVHSSEPECPFKKKNKPPGVHMNEPVVTTEVPRVQHPTPSCVIQQLPSLMGQYSPNTSYHFDFPEHESTTENPQKQVDQMFPMHDFSNSHSEEDYDYDGDFSMFPNLNKKIPQVVGDPPPKIIRPYDSHSSKAPIILAGSEPTYDKPRSKTDDGAKLYSENNPVGEYYPLFSEHAHTGAGSCRRHTGCNQHCPHHQHHHPQMHHQSHNYHQSHQNHCPRHHHHHHHQSCPMLKFHMVANAHGLQHVTEQPVIHPPMPTPSPLQGHFEAYGTRNNDNNNGFSQDVPTRLYSEQNLQASPSDNSITYSRPSQSHFDINVCPYDGIMQNPYDASSYYLCKKGLPLSDENKFNCAHGYIFDGVSQKCVCPASTMAPPTATPAYFYH